MPSAPTLLDALSQAGEGTKNAIHTSAPGVVVSYDRVAQSCSVTPGVSLARRKKNGEIERVAAPTLHNVPVIFLGSGAAALTFDLQAGDTVLLVFAERSIAEWRAAGGTNAEPLDPRRHDIQDAIAIPGLRTSGGAIPAEGYAEDAVVLLGEDIRLGSKDAASAVLLEPLLADLGTVATTLSAWAALSAPSAQLTALQAALAALLAGIGAGSYSAAKVKAE